MLINLIQSMARRLRTNLAVFGKGRYLVHGADLHVGKNCRLWAPNALKIGRGVYIGKNVHIEADCEIGDYCLIANQVAIIGRYDHDFTSIGFPVRYAPWIGSRHSSNPHTAEKASIEQDVWLGYGSIIMTGVAIGRGAIVAAGSVVAHNIPPYAIAAGVPARIVGHRFTDDDAIRTHESKIASGTFKLSERGFDYCLVQPGNDSIDAQS